MDTGLKLENLLGVSRGEVLRLRDAKGRHLGVVHGTVWITQHGELRDAVVARGESFRFDRDGLALVQALNGPAGVVLEAGLLPERAVAAPGIPPRPVVNWMAIERAARRRQAEAVGEAIVAAARFLRCQWVRLRPARPAPRRAHGLSEHLLRDIGLRREQLAWLGHLNHAARRSPPPAPCG